MAAETQYTANTGMVQISTANSNLDGTGSGVETVITAASNGTYIPRIFIKSITNTVEGTVRFFIFDGTNTRIINEVHVPQNTKSGTNPAFEFVWNADIKLKAGWSIKVSTQYADTFNVIAEGLDWAYYSSSVRPESTNFTANTGLAIINSANTSLDGTSTVTVLQAGAVASGWKGCRVDSINIKAMGAVVNSIVRFFISDGTNVRLFKEVMIPGMAQVGTQSTYENRINMGEFNLKAGYLITATTETSQSFAITIDGCDWKYPA